jgi:hypothetical protein
MFIEQNELFDRNPEGIVCSLARFSHKIPSGFFKNALFGTINIDSLREFEGGWIVTNILICNDLIINLKYQIYSEIM